MQARNLPKRLMMIHKSDKIKVLEMIKKNQPLPEKDEGIDMILLDLVADGCIQLGSNQITLTYFGLTELQSWDSILEVVIDNQLLCPHGEA